MDLQYFCEKLSQYYQEYINSVLWSEKRELRNLIQFYLRCINVSISAEFEKPDIIFE